MYNIDFLEKYIKIMDALWHLNQSMIESQVRYMDYENKKLKSKERDNNDDDLPF